MKQLISRLLREGLLTELGLPDAWTKFYSDKTKFPVLNGDENLFNKLNDLYPNNGVFNKGLFTWLYNLRKNNQLKDEDLYKAKEYLAAFIKFTTKIPQANRDINQYKTLPELYDVVKEFLGAGADQPNTKTAELKNIRDTEIKRLYEDNKWKVMVPLTEAASCLIGKNTQWCTSADKSQNMFEEYNKINPLHVIINKNTNQKYQLFIRDYSDVDAYVRYPSQFKDALDKSISIMSFLAQEAELTHWLEENIVGFYDYIVETHLKYSDQYTQSGDLFDRALKGGNSPYVENLLRLFRGTSYISNLKSLDWNDTKPNWDEDDEDEDDEDYGLDKELLKRWYIGFVKEKNAKNITDVDVNTVVKYFDNLKAIGYLNNILQHLDSLGIKSKALEKAQTQSEVSDKNHSIGLNALKKYNLVFGKYYKSKKDEEFIMIQAVNDYYTKRDRKIVYSVEMGYEFYPFSLREILKYIAR